MINALRTGSQVATPNYINPPTQQTTAGADMLGAANSQYNAQLGAVNAQNAQAGNFTNGLFSLGGAAMMAPVGKFSDKRLKTNIEYLYTEKHGLNVYAYDKFGDKEIGVMAQEVQEIMPHAVMEHPSGYLMVNYGALV